MRYQRQIEAWSRMNDAELAEECVRVVRNSRGVRDRVFFEIRNELWFFCSQSGRARLFEAAIAAVKAEENQARKQTERALESIPRKDAV